MEPTVDTFILHPAILIAAGFESISSKQIRFLNALRAHFDAHTIHHTDTLVVSKKDFELGGVMNPFGNFYNTDIIYKEIGQSISNFPYLSKKEIYLNTYKSEVDVIWKALQIELFLDLSQFCIDQKRPRDYFQSTLQVIHELSPYPIYQKITALHSCGLKSKLTESFEYIFRKFISYEMLIDQPIVVSK